MNEKTYTAPPAFLAGIPTDLLVRKRAAGAEMRRANELVAYCQERKHHPSFLDLEAERARR